MTSPPGSSAPGARIPASCLDALQDALAAEHRAVFGYGLLGPRLAGDPRALAASCGTAHEGVRDETAAVIAAAGRTPVGPLADYPALFPVATEAAALGLAVRLEDAAAAAWRYVYATAADASGPGADAVRARAQRELTAAAVRGVRWRVRTAPTAASVPFPGI